MAMCSRRNSLKHTFAKPNKFLRSTAISLDSGSIPYSAFILYMNCSRGLLYRFTMAYAMPYGLILVSSDR